MLQDEAGKQAFGAAEGLGRCLFPFAFTVGTFPWLFQSRVGARGRPATLGSFGTTRRLQGRADNSFLRPREGRKLVIFGIRHFPLFPSVAEAVCA